MAKNHFDCRGRVAVVVGGTRASAVLAWARGGRCDVGATARRRRSSKTLRKDRGQGASGPPGGNDVLDRDRGPRRGTRLTARSGRSTSWSTAPGSTRAFPRRLLSDGTGTYHRHELTGASPTRYSRNPDRRGSGRLSASTLFRVCRPARSQCYTESKAASPA